MLQKRTRSRGGVASFYKGGGRVREALSIKVKPKRSKVAIIRHVGRNVQEVGGYVNTQERSRLERQARVAKSIETVLTLRKNMHTSTKEREDVCKLTYGIPATYRDQG